MTITFIGHGYVGLVTAAVFADLGNTVWVIGHTKEKIENLKQGVLPIYEPGLEEIVKRNVKAKRLLFTLDYDHAIPASEIIFIAVGTPTTKNGEADLNTVFSVSQHIGKYIKSAMVVAVKSTVPVGTNSRVKEIIAKTNTSNAPVYMASVPEFLREGQAINDTLHPDRIIIGTDTDLARDRLLELHKPIDGQLVTTDIATAEMIKYASNAFLATKISFANAIAKLSELTNANGLDVLRAVGLDKRIGSAFLQPGAGFGGSCFPKDVKALIAIARQHKYSFDLLKAVEQVNDDAMHAISRKAIDILEGVNGKTIGILGLSFKPDTDDMRDAPSLVVIDDLQKKGANIRAYDPIAMENAKRLLSHVTFCDTAYDVAKDADAVIVITEWNEFKELDLVKLKSVMRGNVLIDCRNIYDSHHATTLGFVYKGVGR